MRVLIACEFSGVVREAFRRRGHDAWSCDLLPSEIPGPHIEGDVLEHLDEGWGLMVAHPPCTRLTNSGVVWLEKRNLWKELDMAACFFRQLLKAPVERIAVENPIPHRYALECIGRKYDQIIQPWMFGHTESKATCLWLKNLPPLAPTHRVKQQMLTLPKREQQKMHWMPPGPDRWKNRSRTYQGIAEAMAEQWSNDARHNPVRHLEFDHRER